MMRRRRLASLPAAHINLTSMLDITFVLLIAFMVVAPALRYNIDLQLPKVSNSKSTDNKKPVTVAVTYSSEALAADFYLNGKLTALESLPDEIKSSEDYSPTEVVALEADQSVPWQHMAELINTLKLNEIHNLGIVTERGSN